MEYSNFFKSEVWIPLSSFLVLLLVDFLLGVVTAIKNKTFSWGFVGNWVQKMGMQGIGLIILGALAAVKTEVFVVYYPAVITAGASMVNSIINKIKEFTTVPETQSEGTD